jgi:predicted dehydrogenase
MLRGAIVGFGEIARHGHWPAYRASGDVEIVAIVDRSEERRAVASGLTPEVAIFATIDELSERAVDFIDICTPPAFHGHPMLAALERGWHVLCEKPLLLDPLLLETVRDRARRAGVAVVPVHNWKYAPIVQRATESVRAGAIGRLRRVEIETVRLRAAPTAEPRTVNWRRDRAIAGGGILMDHGWHAVYLALHWFGQPPTDVRASLDWPIGAVEDEASVTIAFPDGQASISVTWRGEVRSNRMRLVGDLGEILIDDDTLRIGGGTVADVRFPRALSAGSHHDDWFAAMLPDVVRCFRSPALADAGLREAATCLAIIRRAYECADGSAVSDG